MVTERLFHVLSFIHPLSEDFKFAIQREVTQVSLTENTILLQPPEISQFAYFLKQGLAISYTIHNETRVVEWIWGADQIILIPGSFFARIPTIEIVQLAVPSVLLSISYAGAMRLLNSFPEAHIIYRAIINNYYETARERVRDLQRLEGAERYRKLLRAFHGIDSILPQKQIASFLGITPQSLSRIKRKRNREL